MNNDTARKFSDINKVDMALRLAGLENDFALARFMGISRQWVSQARKNNRLSTPMIRKFASLLGMDEKQAFAIFDCASNDKDRFDILLNRFEEQVKKLELLSVKAEA